MTKTSYTLKDIPNGGFWRQVKILAATKGVTIKQLILSLLEGAITEREKGESDER